MARGIARSKIDYYQFIREAYILHESQLWRWMDEGGVLVGLCQTPANKWEIRVLNTRAQVNINELGLLILFVSITTNEHISLSNWNSRNIHWKLICVAFTRFCVGMLLKQYNRHVAGFNTSRCLPAYFTVPFAYEFYHDPRQRRHSPCSQ